MIPQAMRCFLILMILGWICGPVTAQEGLKLGAYLTPALTLPINTQDGQQGATLRNRSAFSYNAGVQVGYGLTELFSLSTGLAFHQFTASFEHGRQLLPDGRADDNFGAIALRRAQYMRVPLLFGISTDPNRPWGIIGRIGPHFDFLLDAVYFDERLIGYSQYQADQGIDLRQAVTLYEPTADGSGLMRRGDQAAVYRDFLFGITAQIGVQVRVNDQLKFTFMIHAEASSNPEDEGAASLGHNLNRGDYLVTSNPLVDRTAANADQLKFQDEGTPFEAVFPNYDDDNQPFVTERAPTWNTMLGLQIGLVYTLKNQGSVNR